MGSFLDALRQMGGGVVDVALGTAELLDTALDLSKQTYGTAQYGIARGLRAAQNAPLGIDAPFDALAGTDLLRGDLTNLLAAYEQGYNGYSGGRAVWEQMQSDNPDVLQAAMDIAADPLTVAGGPVLKLGKFGLGAGATLATTNPVAGRALQAAAAPVYAFGRTGRALDQASDKVLGAPLRFGGRQLRRALGSLTDLTPRDALTHEVDTVQGAATEMWGREADEAGLATSQTLARGMAGQNVSYPHLAQTERLPSGEPILPLPAQVTPGPLAPTPSLPGLPPVLTTRHPAPPPFTTARGDGVIDPDWDGQVRSTILDAADRAWSDLQRRRVYQPRSKGSGAARLLRRFANPTLGIINTPPGGFRNIPDALEDADLDELATIGIALMDDWERRTGKAPFRAIRRAGEGMRTWREGLVNRYGYGIEGILPAVLERQRQLEQARGIRRLPHPIFSTRFGMPTADEQIVKQDTKQYRKGDIRPTPLGAGASAVSGNPTLVDQAAATGAALFRLGRQGGDPVEFLPGGKFFPDVPPKVEGKSDPALNLLMPRSFGELLENNLEEGPGGLRVDITRSPSGQTYANNREAYNAAMRETFGPDLTDADLNNLWKRSTEIFYRTLLQQAQPYFSGPISAILEAARQGGVIRKGNAENYGKIGAHATGTSAEGTVTGSAAWWFERGGLPFDTSKLKTDKHGRPSAAAVNKALAAHYGVRYNKSDSARQIAQKIEAAGHTAYFVPDKPAQRATANPTGGLPPNREESTAIIQRGRQLANTAGDSVEKWYEDVADFVVEYIGPGRPDDAALLIDLLGVTSSGEQVDINARKALRAYALIKMGDGAAAAKSLGIAPEEVDSLIAKAERHFDQEKSAEGIRRVWANYRARRDRASNFDPTRRGMGGPKTHQYTGSMYFELWKKTVAQKYANNPALRDTILKAINDAEGVYTSDRHDNRIWKSGTSPDDVEYAVNRESGRLLAQELGMTSHGTQAAGWYWSMGSQGFIGAERSRDIINALRRAWGTQTDPGKIAKVRQAIKEVFPEADEGEISNIAREWQIQELIRNEMVRAGLDPLDILEDSADLVRNRVPAITRTLTRDYYPQMLDGKIDGVTINTAGQPVNYPNGYAVAVASAGLDGKLPLDPEGVEREIRRFLTQMGPVLNGPYGEQAHFGFFKFPDENASFDLTFILPDEETARVVGRMANQHSIWDFARQTIVETGGTGRSPYARAQDVNVLLDDLFGGKIAKALEEARALSGVGIVDLGAFARGFRAAQAPTLSDLDALNPVSIFQRKVAEPLLRRYTTSSLNRLVQRTAERYGPEVGDVDPRDIAAVDFAKFGDDPLLSTESNQILKRTLATGETYRDALNRFRREAVQDQETLFMAGVDLDQGLDRLLREADPETRRILTKYKDLGITPKGRPEDVAVQRMARTLADERGVPWEKSSFYDLFRAAWGEQALASPRYLAGNLFGGWLANALAGVAPQMNPGEYLRAYRRVKGDFDADSLFDPEYSVMTRVARSYGLRDAPRELFRGGSRNMTVRRESTRSVIGQAAGRVAGERVGKWIGTPFEAVGNLGTAIDTVVRASLWTDVFEATIKRETPRLEAQVREMAARQGIALENYRLLTNPVALREDLLARGFNRGYAERAARNLAETVNQARRAGLKEVEKRQFSYLRTNLDEKIARVMPFHYWASRALRYYGEESIRHPALLLNYWRMVEGIERMQEEPGNSARAKGFLQIMGGPTGFTLLMNPDALLGVVKAFGLVDNYAPTGETELGKLIREMKSHGVGLYPWIDSALNLLGTYGSTFEPDMLGIRHRALVGAAINYGRSQGWLGDTNPAGAPYADLNAEARAVVSRWGSRFLPDWMSQPVEVTVAGSIGQASLESVIASRIIAENPQLTNAELIDIMADPESPEYQSAYDDAASAGLIQQLLNFTLPTSFRARENSREVRTRGINAIREEAARRGVEPADLVPTTGDVEFAAHYQAMTGRAYQPGDFNRLSLERELTMTVPEARPFVVWEAEYKNIGTPRVRQILATREAIARGEKVPIGFPRPRTLQEAETIASQWVVMNGYDGEIQAYRDAQREYRRTHPEFDLFKTWQGQMYDLMALLGGTLDSYRARVSAENPNAARFFEERARYIQETYPQTEWAQRMDEATASADAWFAITGRAKGVWDARPRETGGYYDPSSALLESMQPSQPWGMTPTIGQTGLPQGGWRDLLRQYQ